MPARKKSRVKSAARSARLSALWKDETKGPDGLTYAERMRARGKAQAAARKAKGTPPPPADPPPPTPPADPPPPPASGDPKVKAPERRGYTPGRAWR